MRLTAASPVADTNRGSNIALTSGSYDPEDNGIFENIEQCIVDIERDRAAREPRWDGESGLC
jgi:hypothetical protein